jgi:uncharacterized lipoprotein YddW (UPF0748 family)
MKRLIFFIIHTTIFVSILSAQPKREIRGVWITVNYALDWPKEPVRSQSDIERQKADLDQMLDKFEKTGINMIFLQTRIQGSVIYPSKIEPLSEYFSSEYLEYDPLAYAIKACHRRGIECHAWVVVYPLRSGKRGRVVSISDRYKSMVKSYNRSMYLDPGNPETTDYLVSLIREVVSGYDIDGIHFDYVRYPNNSDKFPDEDTYERYGNGKDKADWRRENINRFVYAAYDEIKSLKPWVQVSSSVVGMYDKLPESTRQHWTAFHSVYQDPADWLQKGKHDFIVPMMYYSGELFFPFVDDWLTRSNGRFVVPGLGLYQMDSNEFGWEPEVLLEQIRYSRDLLTQGNVFFRARYLLENKKGICDEISSLFYSTPTILPALTWLSHSLPKAPKQIYARKNDDFLLLDWDTMNISQTTEKTIFYNIYRSGIFPVDTNNSHNLVVARLENNYCQIPIDNRFESGYYYVVTSYDRYHNESVASNPVYFVTGAFEK